MSCAFSTNYPLFFGRAVVGFVRIGTSFHFFATMKNAHHLLLLAFACFSLVASTARSDSSAARPLPDWAENVRTNASAASEADFRDRSLLPLLRAETLDRFEPPASWSAGLADEARAYVEDELRLAWEGPARMTDRPGPEWGRAYDFTVKEGSRDPFLAWMSVVGQHKWHWDDKARAQLDALEAGLAALPPESEPFRRLLAAHARQLLDPSDDHARALCAAAVRWAESHAARPDRSEAVLRVLAQFVDTGNPSLVPALLRSSADPWIAFALGGDAALARARTGTISEDRAAALDLAAASYRRAWELHPEFPQGATGMSLVCGIRRDREGLRLWFDRAAEARFDLVRLHLDYGLLIGDPDALRAHEDVCLALAGERPGTMLPLCGMSAVIRELNAGGAVADELLSDADRLARVEAGLESVARSVDATRCFRWAAAELVAVLRERRGDVDGSLSAARWVDRPLSDGLLQRRLGGAYATGVRLVGSTGPNAAVIRPIRGMLLRGEAEEALKRIGVVRKECRTPTRSEIGLLEELSLQAFLASRFDGGGRRSVGIFANGAFVDWFVDSGADGNGWKPGNGPNGGVAWASGPGPARAMEFRHPLPSAVEIETEFEVLPGEEDLAFFALRFLPFDGLFGTPRGSQPPLSLRFGGNGLLEARLGPSGEVEADKGCRGGMLDERSVPFPLAPSDAPRRIRLYAVFADGRVELYLGNDTEPVLSEPCSAFGPDAMPNGGKLVFFGRGVRFRGFSFRKPSPRSQLSQEGGVAP